MLAAWRAPPLLCNGAVLCQLLRVAVVRTDCIDDEAASDWYPFPCPSTKPEAVSLPRPVEAAFLPPPEHQLNVFHATMTRVIFAVKLCMRCVLGCRHNTYTYIYTHTHAAYRFAWQCWPLAAQELHLLSWK